VSYNTGSPCNWTTNQRITYTYDMFDNLIGRTVTGTGATTQHYVFDGTNMVLAFDGNDNLTDRYLWGPAVDQVLADEHFSWSSGSNQLPSAPGTTLWTLGDNQNTVRDVVEDNGTLEQHIAYSPFGQQVAGLTTTGSVVANFAFGYTGTYTDPLTGLQLHGVRWYNPSSQRWLTQDPLGLGPDSNPYRYCGNGPTDGIDPSGMAESGGDSQVYDPTANPAYNQQLIERAKLAIAAYGQKAADVIKAAPAGWTFVSFHSKESMRATLFKNNKTGRYVLAFRGTEIVNLSDATTNFSQGVGLVSDRYEDAMSLAEDVSNDLAKNNHVDFGELELIGHSLGGGLATAAAIANGLTATVFNPAGLHKNTLKTAFGHFWNETPTGNQLTPEQQVNYRNNVKKQITVFAVKYELLATLQDKPGLGQLIMPHTCGTVYNLKTGDWYEGVVEQAKIGDLQVLSLPVLRDIGLATVGVEKHLMETVIRSLGGKP
jgi:RHS repeat-associated protein